MLRLPQAFEDDLASVCLDLETSTEQDSVGESSGAGELTLVQPSDLLDTLQRRSENCLSYTSGTCCSLRCCSERSGRRTERSRSSWRRRTISAGNLKRRVLNLRAN